MVRAGQGESVMTPAPEPVLSPEELGELRHEMRTPFNAIIGYTEMLLEAAEEEGQDAFRSPLSQLHSAGRDLLGVVNTALAPGGSIRSSDLWRLGGEVQARIEPLAAQVEALLDLARQGGVDRFLPDLGRIRNAVGQLMQLAGDRLRGEERLLPPSDASSPTTEPLPGPSPTTSSPARCWGNVLVVDDVEANRDLLCRRLEREGYQAQSARGGGEALALLAGGQFDLVLLDVLMPDVDGYEVLRQIKAAPRLRDVPVIMISALDEMHSVVRCIEMGAEDYLPKPFDPVLLRARVGACLEKKRLRNKELEYLDGVAAVQAAASAVERGTFQAEALGPVAARPDELGTLARVFQRMASEVQAREERLKTQLTQLRIEIDEARKAKHVEEITSDGFFQDLRGRGDRLRARRAAGSGERGVSAP
jgi:DNA-binding response OmpR family regulator